MRFLADERDDAWDARLDEFAEANSTGRPGVVWSPYHYSGWARVRELDGWSAVRLLRDDGTPLAQVLLRRRGNLAAAAYCPGGFLGATPVAADEFVRNLRAHLGVRVLYARVHVLTPTSFLEQNLQSAKWAPVAKNLSSGKSLRLRLDGSEQDRQELLSFNWRRNLRRGERHENTITVAEHPSGAEIASVHKELRALKGQHVNTWESSIPHVERMIEGFNSRLVVVRCENERGVVRAIRGAIITGSCAYDMLAATTTEGRKHYSSYVTFWALANELARRGATSYDLAGIDEDENRGVFDFKNGTGAVPITYGGEFESAAPTALRSILGNLLVRMR